ncbi:MAG: methionyl-tRNA formyltransferase [Bacteroides sp.]|nr:methionyl-tRNA formyltransferase [Prevotella sp.]MCM1407131.1 methionyl-tRNA formyltransferase [Treponema brennaborense]MCM1470283.1 methionyl-tRNA formyltransferase [Bacteroides sp.]
MRILYAGSPEAAAAPLDFLLTGFREANSNHEIIGVLTNPPSPQGRSKKLLPTPVAQTAASYNEKLNIAESAAQSVIKPRAVAVLTPEKLDANAREQVALLKPDILVCFAYGKIFGPKFMALFPRGGINLHPSLLPKYRGCAPIPAAILNQDKETGITVQRIAEEMDTGDILSSTRIPLAGTETAESLLHEVSRKSGKILLDVLDAIEDGTAVSVPQSTEQVSYCRMLKKEDGFIDWNLSAQEIDARIRAFYPWPLAFTAVNGQQLRIHAAAVYKPDCAEDNSQNGYNAASCSGAPLPGTIIGTDKKHGILIQTGCGILAVSVLQWQTKKAMNWKDFLNGSPQIISRHCEQRY